MSERKTAILARVYAAETAEDQRGAYDAWASDYERDVNAYGIRLPWYAAAVFIRHVEPETGPILDAGCGTGMQSEGLALLGYGPFHGIDLSEGMMEIARAKGIYESLDRAVLGEPLNLADNTYAVSYCIGAMTPGHAPPGTFDELIRVTQPGGVFIFSLRSDEEAGVSDYQKALQAQITGGRIEITFQTEPFISMPLGAPDVRHTVYVARVLS